MNIDERKAEIAKVLDLAIDDLEYVTADELAAYEQAEDEPLYDPTVGCDQSDEVGTQRRGVYCNSLVPDSGRGGYLRYKRGERDTANYGCGTRRYRIPKEGTSIRVIGTCSGGRRKYLIEW